MNFLQVIIYLLACSVEYGIANVFKIPTFCVIPMMVFTATVTFYMGLQVEASDKWGKLIAFLEFSAYAEMVIIHWIRVEISPTFTAPLWLRIASLTAVVIVNLGQYLADFGSFIPTKDFAKDQKQ